MLETGTARSSWIGPFAKAPGPAGSDPLGPAPREDPVGAPRLAVPVFSAAMTSVRTIRPPGPEPAICEGSRPFSTASLRARGEILIRSFSSRAGEALADASGIEAAFEGVGVA